MTVAISKDMVWNADRSRVQDSKAALTELRLNGQVVRFYEANKPAYRPKAQFYVDAERYPEKDWEIILKDIFNFISEGKDV